MIETIVLHLYFESGFHKYCCFLMFIAKQHYKQKTLFETHFIF